MAAPHLLGSSAALRHPPSADEHKAGTLLALGVHALLVAGLAVGVSWRSHEVTPLSAELWAAVPQLAAPEPAPPPPPPPEVIKPKVEAPPPPPPKVKEPEAQIVTEKKPAEPKPTPDEKLAEEKAQAQARDAERRKQEDARKQEEARQRQEQARVERQREQNLKDLVAQAQLPGSAPTPSPGTDTRSAGPSASYAGRIRARIFPNIVFTDVVPGQAVAEVQVSVAPDGKITSRKLTKSSGVPAWDEAVLRAVDRTEQLPQDEGRDPPSSMLIEFDANQR